MMTITTIKSRLSARYNRIVSRLAEIRLPKFETKTSKRIRHLENEYEKLWNETSTRIYSLVCRMDDRQAGFDAASEEIDAKFDQFEERLDDIECEDYVTTAGFSDYISSFCLQDEDDVAEAISIANDSLRDEVKQHVDSILANATFSVSVEV